MITSACRLLLATTLAALVVAPAALPASAAPGPARPYDFNGDGYTDLAIGAPGESVRGALPNAGVVHVIHGSRSGLSEDGDQLWSQASPGVKGVAQGGFKSGDRFGSALASGDFDRDGFADLAIGVHRDRLSPDERRAGSVNVLYGTHRGLTADRDQLWSQDLLPGTPRHDDDFGKALAAADFNGDGYVDLAIGVPGEEIGDQRQAGIVQVLLGGPDGLTATGSVALNRAMTGAAPDPTGDAIWFGFALVAGNVDGDGYADLAVGMPGGGNAAGDVSLFHGSSTGPSGAGSESWSQDTPGVPDQGETDDRFGGALAMGDIDADGYDDLAVSAYTEEPGPSCLPAPGCVPLWGAGAVTILRGSIDGLTALGSQFWHQDVPGVPGNADQDGAFGLGLAMGDFDRDGSADLAAYAGHRGGSVIVFKGSPDGLMIDGIRRWSQATSGVPGADEHGDAFGISLAVGDYGRSPVDDLVIGVPGEDGGHGRVVLLYGTPGGLSARHATTWSQDTPGIADHAERWDEFGASLAR